MLEKLKSGNNNWCTNIHGMKGKNAGKFSDSGWEEFLVNADSEAYQQKQEGQKNDKQIPSSRIWNGPETDWNRMMGKSLGSMQFQQTGSSEGNTKENIPGKMQYKAAGRMSEETLQSIIGNRGKAPYSVLADRNGRIEFNGVEYYCDFNKNQICLGDMTDINNILVIPLTGGGKLMVNRNSLDDLEKSIKMFAPADVTKIMIAIAQDNKLKQMEQELEDEASGLQIIKDKEKAESFA